MKPTLIKRVFPVVLMAVLACVLAAFPSGGGPIPPALAAAGSAAAAEDGAETAPVTVRAVAQRSWVTPDGDLVIAVVLKHAEKFHTWPAKPGEGEKDPLPAKVAEFAIRTSITIAEQPDWVAGVGNTQYPPTHQAKVADPSGENPTITVECYEGEAVAFIPVVVKADAPAGAQTLNVAVAYQACNDKFCAMPEDVTIEVPIEIVSIGKAATMPPASVVDAGLFKSFDVQRMAELRAGKVAAPASGGASAQGVRFDVFGWKFTIDPRGAGLFLLLFAAFAGGVLLNFTPCVLPVIPLKIMGLANSAGNPARCFYLGSVMSAGVVAFWLVLGVLILTISGFTAISSLFSYPLVILGIGVFILVMGLGMFGLFTVSLPQSVYMLNPKQETAAGSFGFGILTAVLATPCTAPFMGTAAAWAAQTKNPVMVLAVFGAIGLGMAVPYFVLAANPKLVSKMPSAGPASDLVKQVMGGLMIAVSIFFLGNALLGLIPGAKIIAAIMWWAIAAVAIGTAVWMFARTLRITRSAGKRVAVLIVALLLVGVPSLLAVNMTRRDPIPWQDYEAAALAAEVKSGKVIVLDFTAEWCLNCKALEQAVLRQPAVLKVLNDPRVTPIKVDVTAKSAPGWQKLAELNEVGIPLLAVLKKDTGEVIFKSNAYTPQQVIDAVTAALK
jgi:thiol:disulfide interchange protein